MHFSKINNKNSYYLIIHVNKIEGIKNLDFKIRIFTDKKKEYLKIIRIDHDFPIKIINLEKIVEELNVEYDANSIVQFESLDHNFSGSLLRLNPINCSTAVDHLTGG